MRAGADIILTASYQASMAGFMKKGMYALEARETIFSSVMLACMAREKYRAEGGEKANRPLLIGASIGPYGATLADGSEYTGAYMPVSHRALQEYYEPKIEALLAPRKNYRVDFLAFETMPSFEEVKFVLSFMKKFPGARVTVCFSRVEEALRAQAFLDKDPQVAAWGLNCLSVDEMTKGIEAISSLRASGGPEWKPLMIYPNEKAPCCDQVKAWQEKGVRIVGGCCNTGPDDISEISKFA